MNIGLQVKFRCFIKKDDLANYSGNDIAREGEWVWAGVKAGRVPSNGWIESPYVSLEENCLVWNVGRGRDGWAGSSCCNNIGYICQLL